MNKFLLTAVLLTLPFLNISQTQISDFQNFKKTVEQPRKGFIPFSGNEYFIEQGVAETKISLVRENDLELKYIVTDRPLGVGYNTNQAIYANSNSGLIYDKYFLYELYPTHIYVINILNGFTDHIVDLSAFNTSFISDLVITDDHYYFYGKQDAVNAYFAFNRQQETLNRIEFTENKYLNRIGDRLYYYEQNSATVMSYDLIAESVVTVATAASGKFNITKSKFNGEVNLILAEGDSSSIFHIDQDHNLNHLSCLDGVNPTEIYIMSDVILYTLPDSVYVLDRQNCEVITTYFLSNFLSNPLSFRDSRELYDDFVFMSNVGDWSNSASFLIYDIKEESFNQIAFYADFPYLDRAVRCDNKLYFIVRDDIHTIGLLPEVVVLDLDTKLIFKIDNYQRTDLIDIVIGEHQASQKINIYYDTEEESTLQRYNHSTQNLKQVHKFDYLKNTGMGYGFYEYIWYGDRLFFYCTDALYVLENDQVFKILEANSSLYGSTTSGFIIKDDKLHTLLHQDTSTYKITVDLEDYSHERQIINDLTYLDYRRPKAENVIINIPNSGGANNIGYYDIRDEKFKPFKYNGQVITSINFVLSGNHLLLQVFGPAGIPKWIIFNTETETGIPTEIPSNENPTAYPDGKGGFYLVPWFFASGNQANLMYLDSLGKIAVIKENFTHSLFSGGEWLDGEIKSLAFAADEDIIIFSAKGSEFHFTEIPDNGLLNYQHRSFFWKETDELTVLDVPNGVNYDTYIFSFGDEPKKITPNGMDKRLIEAFIENDKVVLLYKDWHNTLFFTDYIFATEQMEIRQSLEIDQNFTSEYIKYADNKYLITFDDNLHGSEPWLYNSVTGSLELLGDIRDGFQGSSAKQYLLSPNNKDVYFTAFTSNGDRQIFTLDQTVATKEFNNNFRFITIIPSPSTGMISLNQSLLNAKIYDINGRVMQFVDAYSKGQQLDLSQLIDGIYFMVGEGEENKLYSGKFIISR